MTEEKQHLQLPYAALGDLPAFLRSLAPACKTLSQIMHSFHNPSVELEGVSICSCSC